MNRNLYQLIFLALLGVLVGHTSQAQTLATNVRLRTDPAVKKVIIEYELPQSLPGDSVYVELETASGRILRPVTVRGDIGKGIKAGPKKLIAWDVVQDNVRLDEEVTVLLRIARVVSSPPVTMAQQVAKPERVTPKKSVLPLIGWVAAAGLTGYATTMALGLNKDVDTYNSKTYASDGDDLQKYKDMKSRIDSKKGTFYLVAGAAVAVVAVNVIYKIVHKKASANTSLLIQPSTQLTSIGLSRRF